MPHTLLTSFAEDSLARRIAVTLTVLAVYRLGEWVPLPGVDLTSLMQEYRPGELSSMLHRLSIFALGVTPLLSALILLELAKVIVPPFARWESATPHRRKEMERWTFLVALAFAAFQGNGIAVALESIGGLVPHPGLAFRAGCITTFVAASALIMWLASVINRFGVGSGFWIFLAMPFVSALPALTYLQHYMWGPASTATIMMMLAVMLIGTIVLTALSKTDAALLRDGQLLWPPILAYALAGFLFMPLMLIVPRAQLDALLATMKTGHPLRLVLIGLLVVLMFLLRDRMLAGRGAAPVAEPRKLPTLVPALALAAIATAGDYLVSSLPLPLMLDGRGLIIVVAVALSVLAAANSARKT